MMAEQKDEAVSIVTEWFLKNYPITAEMDWTLDGRYEITAPDVLEVLEKFAVSQHRKILELTQALINIRARIKHVGSWPGAIDCKDVPLETEVELLDELLDKGKGVTP